jgi:hypothetical protein
MTLKRVRVYATLIAAALWAVLALAYATPGNLDRFGKIKGTDFIQFYAAGSLVRDGRTDLLYDFVAQHARRAALVRNADAVVYMPVQSPQLAVMFAPVTAFGYLPALVIWLAVAAAIYFLASRALWRAVPSLHRYRYEVAACCLAFPAWFSTIVHGQTSVLGLAALTLAMLALRREWPAAAGVALGMLVFKPHWAAAACAVFIAAREWRIVTGILAGAAAQLLAATAAVGVAAMSAYVGMLQSIGRFGELLEPRAGYSLRSYIAVFVPNDTLAWALYAAAALLALAITGRIWRSSAPFELRAAAVPLAIVAISPHVFEYDLLLLGPSYLLLASWIAGGDASTPTKRYVSWALAPLFIAPILTTLPGPVRVQFSVAPMMILLGLLWAESTGDPGKLVNWRIGELVN